MNASVIDQGRLALTNQGNWFAELPPDVETEINARLIPRSFNAGEVIAAAGDAPLHMHQLISGFIKLTAFHPSGQASVLAIFLPGNCFAETAIVANRRLNHTIVAMNDVHLVSLPREDFWDLYNRHNAIPEALCRKFAVALARSMTNRELRESEPLKRLVAMAFANLAETCSISFAPDGCALTIPIKLQDIAAYFGVTRQSIHTAVSHLKDKGLLEKREGVWIIHDRGQLRAECGYPDRV